MPRPGFREWFAVTAAMSDGRLMRYGGSGGRLDRFEKRFADMLGTDHVLTVNGGTAALTAALAAAGIGPGDEVIVPAYTWMATAAAVVMVGAVPVLAEIDDSLTIDPLDIARKITPWTRAVIPVHMINSPCDMDAIMRIARRRGLLVIEDACQAVGVPYKSGYCGAIGHIGAFSFNQHKNLNAGEGGAIATSDQKLFARARNYHDLGAFIRGHDPVAGEDAFIGGNMRVSEITGALLHAQLPGLAPRLARLARRRARLAPILERSNRFRVAPHHDPGQAMSLVLQADHREDAELLKGRNGLSRLLDNSKHVYSNWRPILAQTTFHPAMNPWKWANREIRYTPDMCPRTLRILENSFRVDLSGRAPALLLAQRMERLVAETMRAERMRAYAPLQTRPA